MSGSQYIKDLAEAVTTRTGHTFAAGQSSRSTYSPSSRSLYSTLESGYVLGLSQEDPECNAVTAMVLTKNICEVCSIEVSGLDVTLAADMIAAMLASYASRPAGAGTNPNTHRRYENA